MPAKKKRKPSVDARVANIYAHESRNLDSRIDLRRRGAKGVKDSLPVANYTHEGMAAVMKKSKKVNRDLAIRKGVKRAIARRKKK